MVIVRSKKKYISCYLVLKEELRPFVLKYHLKSLYKIKILKREIRNAQMNYPYITENKSHRKSNLYKHTQNTATKDSENWEGKFP